ncbi:hypothetical protein BH24DEI1_BH24DEI1_11370 [soil metagenome]
MVARDTRAAEDNRRIAAFAAFAIAALPFYLIVPRVIGMALGAQDPTGSPLDVQVAEVVAHPNVYASFGLLSLIVGSSLIVFALALHGHLRTTAPFAMRIATTTGVIAGALFLLAGFGPITTARALPELHAQDQAAAIAMYVINQSVTDRQIVTSTVLFGAFAFIASLLGARAGLFPRALSYLGALAGIVFVGDLLVPGLWLAGLLVMIVWSAWLGVALLRGGRHVTPAPEETMLGRA